MPRVFSLSASAASLLLGLLVGCDKRASEPAAPEVAKVAPVTVDRATLSLFAPLPHGSIDDPNVAVTPQRVALGRMLFFDARLSKNHDVSCNSCHDLGKYGVDNLRVSMGHKKQLGARNAPSVYNAAGHFVQFWDGRSPTVEHQATQPLMNKVEMALSDAILTATLKSIPGYVDFFKKVFPNEPNPINVINVGRAIGAFERTLVTPAPWDKFLEGDNHALSDLQKRGLNLFVQTGCLACHNGPYVGGSGYQKVGAVRPWPDQKDTGRAMLTKLDADSMVFKVPSLRNVAKTAPYFHNGTTDKLADAVVLMARHQLGKELDPKDVEAIVAWLGSLTGELPSSDHLTPPPLPPSSSTTPPPDPS